MTNRERAMNILHYKPADRMPAVHFGYWEELLAEWADQKKIPKELAEHNYEMCIRDSCYTCRYRGHKWEMAMHRQREQ